mmetsp:Transcript_25443/g.42322  ORF Transcript_25443/g.42322 Transcript_25443/m.42322 type:complete len:296 (+) Transcript_25443:131-1018(+)
MLLLSFSPTTRSFQQQQQQQQQQLRRRRTAAAASLDPKTVVLKEQSTKAPSCHTKEDVEFLSQNYEDEIMYHAFFENHCGGGGTVVEMGGLNGKAFSNSWFFEFALGWKSVLVEADPDNYANMVRNRPNAIHLFGAMCLGESVAFQSGSVEATGGTVRDMSAKHREKWVDGNNGGGGGTAAAAKPVITVPCLQVTNVLLHDHQIDHVDIFFLDVEGGELSVLQTIDFGGVGPIIDMFVIEMDGTNPLKDEAIRAILRYQGYIRPFSMVDRCTTRKQFCQISELFVLKTVWDEKKQ